MKFFGKILDPKDLTTKEYVDEKAAKLEEEKVSKEEVTEYTADEVKSLWDDIFKN